MVGLLAIHLCPAAGFPVLQEEFCAHASCSDLCWLARLLLAHTCILLQAQGAVNQVWQVVFHFQNGSLQDMTATEAHALGYGVNTTATRVLFRTPYSTQQTEVSMVRNNERSKAHGSWCSVWFV